ncbi:MAG: hypothetical protein HY720_28430 [Planctomycetes bacterium]|nr:hypothetical protein [Planctomycetota bacterium]
MLLMPCLGLPAYDADVLGIPAGHCVVVRRRYNPAGIPFEGSLVMAAPEAAAYCRRVASALQLNERARFDSSGWIPGALVAARAACQGGGGGSGRNALEGRCLPFQRIPGATGRRGRGPLPPAQCPSRGCDSSRIAPFYVEALHDIDLMTDAEGRVVAVNPRPSGSLPATLAAGIAILDWAVARALRLEVQMFEPERDVEVLPVAATLALAFPPAEKATVEGRLDR